jgi:hypothetical protein
MLLMSSTLRPQEGIRHQFIYIYCIRGQCTYRPRCCVLRGAQQLTLLARRGYIIPPSSSQLRRVCDRVSRARLRRWRYAPAARQHAQRVYAVIRLRFFMQSERQGRYQVHTEAGMLERAAGGLTVTPASPHRESAASKREFCSTCHVTPAE